MERPARMYDELIQAELKMLFTCNHMHRSGAGQTPTGAVYADLRQDTPQLTATRLESDPDGRHYLRSRRVDEPGSDGRAGVILTGAVTPMTDHHDYILEAIFHSLLLFLRRRLDYKVFNHELIKSEDFSSLLGACTYYSSLRP